MKKRSVFHHTWKDYLAFTRRERRGIFVLLVIVLLQTAILAYLRYFPSKEPLRDFSKFEKEVNDFYSSLDTAGNDEHESPQADYEQARQTASMVKKNKSELFSFDPNNLPFEDWQRLGFSEKQARVIKNYESKGGKFRSKEDVKKMFCITEKEYARIEPYITIPETIHGNNETGKKKYERQKIMVDIGVADSVELMQLKGIGPSFARRISLYREKLGGFVSLAQLQEVWGFTDSLYQSLLPFIFLRDSSNIRKINLNDADFKELSNHPYGGYKLSGIICNYRKQHPFKSVEEIKKIPLVNDELYSKLAPYLVVE